MPHPETREILWFHPDPRTIIPLHGFHRSKSLKRTLKRVPFVITTNQNFADVMQACAVRPDGADTWIDERFKAAYAELHRLGDAHSLEVWLDGALVGGVYGVSLGGAFFAESMFHRVTDASKVALHHLVERMQHQGMSLLEVQFMTPHLATLGAVEIPRETYLKLLKSALHLPVGFA
jgi:leucyl/phenylalanyl-tRNA--protein transferase